MNREYNKLKARFGPETRFEVKPAPPATFRATQETELERLKGRLLRERLNELTGRMQTASCGAPRTKPGAGAEIMRCPPAVERLEELAFAPEPALV